MTSYGKAIREGFAYLLENHKEVFAIGQGLWSPWYVGSSMTDLDKEFGTDRVIDTPVSELATTGAALGASLAGMKPIVIHPRVDFALLALDQVVNQAAKWSHMFGGTTNAPVTIRLIINRGGEQGAQHSQALHSWFAHIPGLKVVMPYTATDARDLLIASVLDPSPVVFIDDRWLYEQEDDLPPAEDKNLQSIAPKVIKEGKDVTLVGTSYSTLLCKQTAELLQLKGIEAEVIDMRIINPLNCSSIIKSVEKTGRLIVVDGDWSSCGLAGEIIAKTTETVPLQLFKSNPIRITLPDAPAPTSKPLEKAYYPTAEQIAQRALETLK